MQCAFIADSKISQDDSRRQGATGVVIILPLSSSIYRYNGTKRMRTRFYYKITTYLSLKSLPSPAMIITLRQHPRAVMLDCRALTNRHPRELDFRRLS
ncbi:hypothetical protein SCHPADRAFT_580698 [Schizopora paradoxa]|uniref:Uncharacterized protein n=1 Tax=Schizopora paradoxa TaxID=27342 RepID=A0A0H2RHW2_9AGAM|nr:hypothetical protein SCHPADRAFT_580698 [Schizopora paradoxa]